MSSKAWIGWSLAAMVVLILALAGLRRSADPDRLGDRLVVYSAAGLQAPVAGILAEYERHVTRVRGRAPRVEIQYGGSGTLLSLLRVSGRGDLFVAGDDSFIRLGREQGLIREAIPLAVMTPVIGLAQGQGGRIRSLTDLLKPGLRVGIGMPDGTAIGAATRQAFRNIGQWEAFETALIVTKPTVNDLAGDLQIGALDAAIIFDVTALQYGLDHVRDPVLDEQSSQVMVGVLESAPRSAAALHLARFMGAPEHGLAHFRAHHFEVTEGDTWAETPEIMLFSGGINKRAMDVVIDDFEQREGVRVRTVFQGCGGLTAQMRAMTAQSPEHGFPDGYLACDVYYLDPVSDWFSHQAAVSSTRIVIVTALGNPKNIQRLEDLGRPGLRVVLGHPTHCTIGALSDRLLRSAGLYEPVAANVVERQPSSGMMVPPVLSGAADASLAYYTDTLPERDRLHVIELVAEHGDFARAAQPYGISVHSPHRRLMERFYAQIGRFRETYELLGFNWEFGRDPGAFGSVAPAGARPHRRAQDEP